MTSLRRVFEVHGQTVVQVGQHAPEVVVKAGRVLAVVEGEQLVLEVVEEVLDDEAVLVVVGAVACRVIFSVQVQHKVRLHPKTRRFDAVALEAWVAADDFVAAAAGFEVVGVQRVGQAAALGSWVTCS